MKLTRRIALILSVLVLCVGCDQTTKSIAKATLSEVHVQSILGDTLRLQIAHNAGAFLSWGDSLPPAWRQALLSGGVAAVLIAILFYACLSKTASTASLIALSLIVGGGLSNLIDRFMYHGYVVDFINLGLGRLRTGIFNVADVAIMAGVFLLACNLVGAQERGHTS